MLKIPPTNYEISYDLGGGTLPDEKTNPTSYNEDDDDFALVNPIKAHWVFTGWTGSNGSEASTAVTVDTAGGKNLMYTANWTPVLYQIVIDGAKA